MSGGEITPKSVAVSQVHGDLDQEVIQITVDRVSLILERHVERSQRSRDWVAPAGILVAIILTVVTATFHDWLLKAAVWQAIFVLLGIASSLWLAVTIFRRAGAESVDQLVDRIKRSKR